jgi:prophage antirepressor-like protein
MTQENSKTTDIQIHKSLTAYGTLEEPLFDPGEVAEWLGYHRSYAEQILKDVGEDETVMFEFESVVFNETGRLGTFLSARLLLTENGLYETVMQSKVPQAREYKKRIKQVLKDMRVDDRPKHERPMSDDDVLWKAVEILNDQVAKHGSDFCCEDVFGKLRPSSVA